MESLNRQLQPWSHEENGIVLRGWMSENCGRNNRPVIHFLHGTGLSNLTYWPFLQFFSRDYDLFLNSIEGHGDSDLPARRRSRQWNPLAERCLRAYEHHSRNWDASPVIALGHSLGAILTLLMMDRASRPFDQYVLLDPVFYPKPMIATLRLLNQLGMAKHVPVAKKAGNRRNRWPSREAALSNLKGRGVFKSWSEESLAAYIDHGLGPDTEGNWQLRCSPWLEARLFSGYPKGLWSAIRRLPPGSEIIHSEDTYPFIPPTVRKAEQANNNIRLTVAQGSHCFMQEYPQQSYRQVASKLRV